MIRGPIPHFHRIACGAEAINSNSATRSRYSLTVRCRLRRPSAGPLSTPMPTPAHVGIFCAADEADEAFVNRVPTFDSGADCAEFMRRRGPRPSNPGHPKLKHIISTLIGWGEVREHLLGTRARYLGGGSGGTGGAGESSGAPSPAAAVQRIRRAVAADVPAVVDCINRAFAIRPGDLDYAREAGQSRTDVTEIGACLEDSTCCASQSQSTNQRLIGSASLISLLLLPAQ